MRFSKGSQACVIAACRDGQVISSPESQEFMGAQTEIGIAAPG
jgi:hypothetical protein